MASFIKNPTHYADPLFNRNNCQTQLLKKQEIQQKTPNVNDTHGEKVNLLSSSYQFLNI